MFTFPATAFDVLIDTAAARSGSAGAVSASWQTESQAGVVDVSFDGGADWAGCACPGCTLDRAMDTTDPLTATATTAAPTAAPEQHSDTAGGRTATAISPASHGLTSCLEMPSASA